MSGSPKPTVRPNFLFLLPDQHRRDWTGANRTLDVRTPVLDRLAAQGVRFTRAYTPSPLCAPARACLATGRSYRACGVPTNQHDLPLSSPTYYRRLTEAGYRVGGVGKFDLHKATLDWGLDGSRDLEAWGFTDGIDNEGKFDGTRSYRNTGAPCGPYLEFLANHGYAETHVAEHSTNREQRGAYTTAIPDELYCDNWVAENGCSLLEGFPSETPWHLVVNFTGPHNPMDVTESMRRTVEARSFPGPVDAEGSPPATGVPQQKPGYTAEDHLRNRQNYAAMIENIDRQIGRLIDLVESRGELERTVIIYASDHGEMLGDHGLWGKVSWFEASAGVPMLVRIPESVRGDAISGVTTDALVSLHDLSATMLELANAEPLPLTSAEDAKSLVPLLTGECATHRDYVTSALDADAKPAGNRPWRMVTDGRYKLVEATKPGSAETTTLLYDLGEDPDELSDIASANPTEVARLTPRLR